MLNVIVIFIFIIIVQYNINILFNWIDTLSWILGMAPFLPHSVDIAIGDQLNDEG